jgi:nucleotide-binding universal stress UspA family protein
MIKLNRILWPTDFSRCAKQALGHAVHWAREYDAELHALHAAILLQNDSQLPNKEELYQQLKDLAKATTTTKGLQTDELKIKQTQVRGISTAPAILVYAKKMTSIDRDGNAWRRRLGTCSPAASRKKWCVYPRAGAHHSRARSSGPRRIMKRILVPIDFPSTRNRMVYAGDRRLLWRASAIAASSKSHSSALHGERPFGAGVQA